MEISPPTPSIRYSGLEFPTVPRPRILTFISEPGWPEVDDYVVLSLGVRPDNMLYEQLKDKVKNIYLVGDAVKTGRIAHATESAYQIATKLN